MGASGAVYELNTSSLLPQKNTPPSGECLQHFPNFKYFLSVPCDVPVSYYLIHNLLRLWLLLTSFLKKGLCSNMFKALFCLTVVDNISSTDHQFLGFLNPHPLLSHANLLHPLGKAYLGNQQISQVSIMQLFLV